MNRILFLPFAYGFNTRAKTLVHRLSFFALILAPILINVLLMTEFKLNAVVFILSFVVMYVTYEIGYVFNDVYTVAKENKPTQWLEDKSIAYVNDKYPLLIAIRILYIMLILSVLKIYDIPNYEMLVIGIGLMNLAFAFHNYYRGKQNVFTDGALQLLKYTLVLLPFGEGSKLIMYMLFIYIEIALERTLEFAIGKKHYFKRLQNYNIDNLRIIYYVILLMIASVCCALDKVFISFIIGVIYLLMYRIFCRFLTSNKKIQRVRSNNSKEVNNE